MAAESRCNALSAELDKAGHEAKRLNDQVMAIRTVMLYFMKIRNCCYVVYVV